MATAVNEREAEFTGKVALITGAGEGIGRATAKLLANQGAKIGVLGRTRENIENAAEEIRKDGGTAKALHADVSKPDEVKQAIQDLVDEYGQLDILFAHAGINGLWAPIDDLVPEEWNRTMQNNLSGAYFTIHYAAPHLKKTGGSIVVTSSVNGTRIFSNRGSAAYATSKAGLVALTKVLSVELGPHKVRINAICPGSIDTAIDDNTETKDLDRAAPPAEYPEGEIPLTGGEPGTPEECADLVAYLVGKRSRHITGSVVHIGGAQGLMEG